MATFTKIIFIQIIVFSLVSSVISIVHLKQGDLEGVEEVLPSGKKYQSYKGIPYAKPPIGNLRFKDPLPAENWNGVRNAAEHGPSCAQLLSIEVTKISEDCLTLNVYTQGVKNDLKPVMVWFHGGGFYMGSGDQLIYGPEYLLEEDVLIVTVNYRLEVFGFLSLDIEEVPGNAGMKDQVMALKWVKENIEKFGGDPEKVTIFGESAGGASVTYHLVSPMSKGLFHRAITESGSFFNPWAHVTDASKYAYKLGKHLGFDTNDPYKLLSFLQNTSYDKFIDVTSKMQNERDKISSLSLYFCPTIEKTFHGKKTFLPNQPLKLIEDGHMKRVPIIIGYNNNEGLYFVRKVFENAVKIQNDFTLKIPREISSRVTNIQLQEIAKTVQKFYYGNESIEDNSIYKSCDLESDNLFLLGIWRLTVKLSEYSNCPIFFYRYSADGYANILKFFLGYFFISGATHGEELFSLFKNILINFTEGSNEWGTMKNMTKMWTNFAKYGNPTPDNSVPIKWKAFNRDRMNFLEINFDLKNDVNPDKKRFNFWKGIYDKYDLNF